jgi:tetratricopeptide (TPR) repeat protein
MKTAVLPMNAVEDRSAPLARQMAGFLAEMVRSIGADDIQAISLMARFEEDGIPRFALVNPSKELNGQEELQQLFQDGEVEKVIDGLLSTQEDGSGEMTARWFKKGDDTAFRTEEIKWGAGEFLSAFRRWIEAAAEEEGVKVEDNFATDQGLYGTENSEAFMNFLAGFDGSQYIDRAQGQVAKEFNSEESMEALAKAVELDTDWEAPMLAQLHFCSSASRYQLTDGNTVHSMLEKLSAHWGDDSRVLFSLGDFYMAAGDLNRASEAFEKATVASPEEPVVWSRLGVVQMNLNMPVNAERSLRKAVELEPEGDKRSLEMLSGVLDATGRRHEIATMWKDQIDANPQYSAAYTYYARALQMDGREDEAIKMLDEALKMLDDSLPVKRFYAPLLRTKGEFDQAMDFYEDFLDENPTDTSVMMEYAETLKDANREFEVPQILRDVLTATDDQNLKAHAQAWLIEIEQPQRVEIVKAAEKTANEGDFETALKDLKPMQNWLADYWKLWAATSAISNRVEKFAEGEAAAKQLLEIFPGCEPGYGELCTALYGLDRAEEAFQIMGRVLSQMPQSLSIAVNFALAAKKSGHEEESNMVARQIREQVGNEPPEELKKVFEELGV